MVVDFKILFPFNQSLLASGLLDLSVVWRHLGLYCLLLLQDWCAAFSAVGLRDLAKAGLLKLLLLGHGVELRLVGLLLDLGRCLGLARLGWCLHVLGLSQGVGVAALSLLVELHDLLLVELLCLDHLLDLLLVLHELLFDFVHLLGLDSVHLASGFCELLLGLLLLSVDLLELLVVLEELLHFVLVHLVLVDQSVELTVLLGAISLHSWLGLRLGFGLRWLAGLVGGHSSG